MKLNLSWIFALITVAKGFEQQAQPNDGLPEEKQWMPWPSSLKDPKKDYTTLTLDPETLTENYTVTSTHHITKTVYSHLTEFYTETNETERTTTTTLTHNPTITKTIYSTMTERVSHTAHILETRTQTFTSTINEREGELKLIGGGRVSHQTNFYTTRATSTIGLTKTMKAVTRKTIHNVNTLTITNWRTTHIHTTETLTITSSSKIIIKDTVTVKRYH